MIKMIKKLTSDVVINSIKIRPYKEYDRRYRDSGMLEVCVNTGSIADEYLNKSNQVWMAECGFRLGYPPNFEADALAIAKARKVIDYIEDRLIEKFRKYRTSFIKGFLTYPGLFDINGSCNIEGNYFRIGDHVAIHMKVDSTTDKPSEKHIVSYSIKEKSISVHSFGDDTHASLSDIATDEFKRFVSNTFPQASYDGFKDCTNRWSNISLEQLLE